MWIACLLTSLVTVSWAEPPTHRAVLAAVAGYSYDPPPLGWSAMPLHTDRDLELMEEALKSRGFQTDHITPLLEEQATRQNILDAIDQRLVAEAQPGDHLFFFWSGHGQQLADDDDGEEFDRLDEAVVAWGARRTSVGGYDGRAHLRDDDLGVRLLAMRRAVGPEGSVVVAIDSCHSGTAARNVGVVRGGAEPLSDTTGPRTARTSDFSDAQSDKGELAPYVVLTAARAHQLAREVPVGRETHGAFSGALSQALASDVAPTWSGILDVVRAQVMAQVADQVPQLEGQGDLGVFGSASAASEASFRIDTLDGLDLTVAAGTLHGVTPGSVVAVHPAGTARLGDSTALATGDVVEADLLTSRVTLATPPENPSHLLAGRAFVVQTATGDLRLTVTLDAGIAARLDGVDALAHVQRVEMDGEVRLVEEAGHLLVVHRAKAVLRVPKPLTDENKKKVLEAVQNLAYTKLLTGVRLSDPNFAATLQLRPATKVDGQCVPTGERFPMDGNEFHVPEGSRVQIVLHPTGRKYYYPTIVNTDASGLSQRLFPRHAAQRGNPHDGEWVLPGCLRVERAESPEKQGSQQLTLLVTSAPIDLSPLLPLARSATREGLAPIQTLLDGLGQSGTGMVPSRGEQSGYSASFVYTVVPAAAD